MNPQSQNREDLLQEVLAKPGERWLLRELVAVVQAERFRPSCLNCANFQEGPDTCGLTNGRRPPARVIVNGCPAFVEQIPF